MPPEIPGHHYDSSKKKYFKIEKNHQAAPGSKYSEDAVRKSQAASAREVVEVRSRRREKAERLGRSKLLAHPLNRLLLKRQLGERSNVTADVAAYYAAMLGVSFRSFQGGTASASGCHNFALDETTETFFAARCEPSNSSISLVQRSLYLGSERGMAEEASMFPPINRTMHGMYAAAPSHLLFTPRRHLLWVHNGDLVTDMYLQPVAIPDSPSLHEQFSVSEYTTVIAFHFNEVHIWGIAASAAGSLYAAAHSGGIYYWPVDSSSIHSLNTRSLQFRKEAMTVDFRGEQVIVTGHRRGAVRFSDIRVGESVQRLYHPSAVTATRTLSNPNYVLVRGMKEMNIYDLRYTAAQSSSRQNLSHQRQAISTPCLTISNVVPSDRFGLGFDYDAELGLIASAHSNSMTAGLSLFSTHTGRHVASVLDGAFAGADVTCVKFTRKTGSSDPKSLVTGSNGVVARWSAEGEGHPEPWFSSAPLAR